MKEKCLWCGKTIEEHEDDYTGRPVPRVPCLMLKSGFAEKCPKAENIENLEGTLVECEMPKCKCMVPFPRKFCDDCQLLAERIEYVDEWLGFTGD